MKNILEIIHKDDRMAILMRDTVTNMYEAHAYRLNMLGEFERLPDALGKYPALAVLERYAKDFVQFGVAPLTNR